MRRRHAALVRRAAALAVALAACEEFRPIDEARPFDDAAVEVTAGPDAGTTDADATAPDAATDAPLDAPFDAPLDAESDASLDVPPDVPSDAAIDAPSDAPFDGRSDAAPDVLRATGVAGDECNERELCAPFTCIDVTMGFPGGYCTAGCMTDSECGPNSVCTEVGRSRVCLRRCAAGGDGRDCGRAGYLCYTLFDRGTMGGCLADCRIRTDATGCGPNAMCNATTGFCQRLDAGLSDAQADGG